MLQYTNLGDREAIKMCNGLKNVLHSGYTAALGLKPIIRTVNDQNFREVERNISTELHKIT